MRILHPARRKTEDGGTRVRWSAIASSTGRVVHPEMQFDRIAALRNWNDDPGWDSPPGEGLLPREDCERLASLLRPHTSTPEVCWFCVWEGYGGFFDAQSYRDVPRVKTPGRAHVLYRGPLEAATSFHWGWLWRSPNLWWPDDRAWCVATEIDLPETYVGGSQACIERILADDQLEAIQTRRSVSGSGRAATGSHLSHRSPTLNPWAKLDRYLRGSLGVQPPGYWAPASLPFLMCPCGQSLRSARVRCRVGLYLRSSPCGDSSMPFGLSVLGCVVAHGP